MPPSVKIFSGFITSKRYLTKLSDLYKKRGFDTKIICPCNKYMFYPPLYHRYNKLFQSEIKDTDMLHCLSGSNFSIIPYMDKNKLDNKIIIDSTGFKFGAPGLLMSLFPKNFISHENITNKYSDIYSYQKLDEFINKYIATEEFQNEYYNGINQLIDNKKCLFLQVKKDIIVDYSNYEKTIIENGMVFSNGKHGKIFDIEENQYYIDIISDFYKKT